ncbi:DNA replication licensing factor MCM4-like, partial [Aphis craccivora]
LRVHLRPSNTLSYRAPFLLYPYPPDINNPFPKKMGDSPINSTSLKDKLFQSSKTTHSKSKATMSNTTHTANTVDNNTNYLLSPAQYSDNDANVDAIKNNDTNIYTHDSINQSNSIQSVPSDKYLSQQDTNIESEKYTTGKKSFAETTINATLPKKEHAIIEYIIAIRKLTPPKNIKYVSHNYPSITIKDQTTIKIRRLINPAKRIIISNVSPAIPNEDTLSHLKDLNIQTLSQITHVNAGFNIAELAHILSFRRQVYINPDDFLKLPGSLLINHENTHHRIFLSDDTLFCYLCKLKGHTSKQ